GGEAPSVKLHHGTEVGGDDRQHLEDHGLCGRISLAEILRNLKPLDELALLLPRALRDLLPEGGGKLPEVNAVEEGLNPLGADSGVELFVVGHAQLILPLEDDIRGDEGGHPLADDDIAGVLHGDDFLLGGEPSRVLYAVEFKFTVRD